MRYKMGDRVKIKSHDWYKSQGDYVPSWLCPCCGRVLTIDIAYTEGYAMKEVQGVLFQDRMIEGLAEGLTLEEFAVEWANFDFNKTMNNIIRKRREENMKRKEQTLEEAMLHTGVICPDGYEFKDENGNVIEAKKIVLEKKKPKCPESYEECCQHLGFVNNELVFEGDYRETNFPTNQWKRLGLINRLNKLLICRDAYWKLAGDWKPDWAMYSGPKHCIIYSDNEIKWQGKHFVTEAKVLAFPTGEMRDAFYENFKNLIEECKELL